MMRPRWAVVVAGTSAASLVACSSGGTVGHGAITTTSRRASSPIASTAAPTTSSGLDSCLIGSWHSTGVSGTLKSTDGSVSVPLSGGAGEVAVIRPDGIIAVNYAASTPETGTGSDGAAYTLTTSGELVGHLVAAAGRATWTIDDPKSAVEAITKDGSIVARLHPPAHEDSTYTCRGGMLAVSSGDLTTTWTKDGAPNG
jgi:hypothetical protein